MATLQGGRDLKIQSQPQHPNTNQRIKSPIEPYQEIAEGMEANFTAHLIKEMRKTVPKENKDSTSMEYYNSLLDHERSQLMAKSDSGLGIKKVILDQIVPHHLKSYLKHQVHNDPINNSQFRPQMTKESTHE